MRDPTFHVYVGKDDDIIRRVAGKIEFDVPEESRESLGGIQSGAIEFEVEFSDVNGDQEIEPPANPRPLSDLTTSLGGGGALPGLGGGSEQTTPTPPTTDGTSPRGTGLPGVRGLPRQGAPGGHRGPPALRRAAAAALDP